MPTSTSSSFFTLKSLPRTPPIATLFLSSACAPSLYVCLSAALEVRAVRGRAQQANERVPLPAWVSAVSLSTLPVSGLVSIGRARVPG